MLPETFRDRFFYVVAELTNTTGGVISRSVYWARCLSAVSVDSTKKLLWEKPATYDKIGESWIPLTVRVKNTGTVPSFMTQIDIAGVQRAFYATDNFTWLAVGETRDIAVSVWWGGPKDSALLTVSAWNAHLQLVKLF